jgi:hypothetical protein
MAILLLPYGYWEQKVSSKADAEAGAVAHTFKSTIE